MQWQLMNLGVVCMDNAYFVNCSNIIVISWFNFPVASCAVNCT